MNGQMNGDIFRHIFQGFGTPLSSPPSTSMNWETVNPEVQKKRMEEKRKKAQDALDRLNSLPGMTSIKEQVDQIIALANIQKKREAMGLKCEKQSLHMIFTGNPGTGKTTAARLIGEAYVALGLIKNELDEIPFVEVHQSEIESGLVGRAEENMNEKFDDARGGVLFMDEAYAFIGPHHYNKTFIANLVQKIEDMRDEVLVIAAGYPEEMEQFLDSNPGLRSRFSNVVDFPDYGSDDLLKIAELMCEDRDYLMTDNFKNLLSSRMEKERRLPGFGNARTIRSILEQSIRRHSLRISKFEDPTKEALMYLIPADLDTAVRESKINNRKSTISKVVEQVVFLSKKEKPGAQ